MATGWTCKTGQTQERKTPTMNGQDLSQIQDNRFGLSLLNFGIRIVNILYTRTPFPLAQMLRAHFCSGMTVMHFNLALTVKAQIGPTHYVLTTKFCYAGIGFSVFADLCLNLRKMQIICINRRKPDKSCHIDCIHVFLMIQFRILDYN